MEECGGGGFEGGCDAVEDAGHPGGCEVEGDVKLLRVAIFLGNDFSLLRRIMNGRIFEDELRLGRTSLAIVNIPSMRAAVPYDALHSLECVNTSCTKSLSCKGAFHIGPHT